MTKNYFIAFFIGVITKAYPQSTSIQEVQSDYIKSSKVTTVPTHYRASKAIVLQSGFRAKGQNSFSAKIQYFPLKEALFTSSLTVSPNPVQDVATISFKIPQSSTISLVVSNASGEPIVELIRNEYKEAGEYRLALESKDWSSGMYLLHLQTTQGITTFKIVKP
ncbi:T9SS type A sorting domain-containing protein [Flectobacillus longus]|uniref:T9SS type A sorting domain-containing protein n=1 Tax=Flectobacillus longus TaxID=2984207 RepID=UPI0024B867B6|nr:T9SS type A sorting domain-containing protein [Flectobacillus longus]MDI9880430.1 T9SS type A sorting domain-containing protein [Flectobacillus longus]